MNGPAPHSEKQTTTIASFSIRVTEKSQLIPESRQNAAPNGEDK
jgi:hypothetical protein